MDVRTCASIHVKTNAVLLVRIPANQHAKDNAMLLAVLNAQHLVLALQNLQTANKGAVLLDVARHVLEIVLKAAMAIAMDLAEVDVTERAKVIASTHPQMVATARVMAVAHQVAQQHAMGAAIHQVTPK